MDITTSLGRVRPSFKGEWREDVIYDKLDVVFANGTSYVAKGVNQGIEPKDTEYWHPLFARTNYETQWAWGIYEERDYIERNKTMYNATVNNRYYWIGDPNLFSRETIDNTSERTEMYWRFTKFFDNEYNKMAIYAQQGGELKIYIRVNATEPINSMMTQQLTVNVTEGWNVIDLEEFRFNLMEHSIVLLPTTCVLALIDESTITTNTIIGVSCPCGDSQTTTMAQGYDYVATRQRLILDFGLKR